MNYRLIVKDRATQDLRQQANYILVNGNADAAFRSQKAEGRRQKGTHAKNVGLK